MSQHPDGALYELVARGKKDIYFISEKAEEGIHPFSQAYKKIEPHLSEKRTQPSRNPPQFGQTIEFDLERYADFLEAVTLVIDMPSWLPDLPLDFTEQPSPPQQANRLYHIKDTDGISHGWVRGVGFFLLESLELFQDKIQIYQTTGEALYFSEKTSGSATQSELLDILTGDHDGSSRRIAANATQGQLRIQIPWPGVGTTPYGFPLLTTLAHTYRIRVKLRRMSELIESDSATSTSPFGKTFEYIDMLGNPISVQSKGELMMKQPTVMLETTQAYMRDELRRDVLKNVDAVWEVPFRRWFINNFPINENDYLTLNTGTPATVTRRLEGVHPTARIWFIVRADADICAGKRWKIMGSVTPTNPEGRYWSTTKLLIAGKDRELAWGPLVTEDLTGLKTEGVMPDGMGAFVFTCADQDLAALGGTINMSQADRASIQMELLDAGVRKTEVLVVSEAWGIYAIEDERGYVRYMN